MPALEVREPEPVLDVVAERFIIRGV